jgi:hypothetical protein
MLCFSHRGISRNNHNPARRGFFGVEAVNLANLEYEWGFCGVQLRGGGVTSPLKMRSPTLAGCIMHNAGIASFYLEMEDLVHVVAEVF